MKIWQEISHRAAQIKVLVCDIDGVFTDGRLYFDKQGEALKAFHIHDGLGIKWLLKSGITVAIITGRSSPIVESRMQELGIKYIYQNQEEKLIAAEDLLTRLQLGYEHIAYIGDDLPDLPLLRRVGLAITVPNANPFIKEHAHWVTKSPGGNGAIREACEYILLAQGKLDAVHHLYLTI
jgi:3-deoxy-D-manno-octulosonate 8-phosphate phosphatase (KDO 8-P phosphatase)